MPHMVQHFADGRDLVDLVDRVCERGFDTGYVSFMELAQKGENHKVGRAWHSLAYHWESLTDDVRKSLD